jgi:outer membrane cobalamin receptor
MSSTNPRLRGLFVLISVFGILVARGAHAQSAPGNDEAADAGAPLPPETDAAAAPCAAPTAAGDAGVSVSDAQAVGPPAVAAEVATVAPDVTPPASESVETIEVRGHKLEATVPRELAHYGTRVETITGEQVENAGRPDVAASLETLAPQLYISPKNGPFDYVNISFQGSRTQDVLWLLDGVRLNNRLYGGATPLDTFPASMVERVELTEGPQALFYGTQAVAGAINVVTKDFSDRTDGQVSLGADSSGGRHLDAYLRRASPSTGSSSTARATSRRGINRTETMITSRAERPATADTRC